jgi:two-component system response regulator RegA
VDLINPPFASTNGSKPDKDAGDDALSLVRPTILIVDPEVNPDSNLVGRLLEKGFFVCHAKSLECVKRLIDKYRIDYALTELKFMDGDAIGIINILRKRHPSCRTIIHSRACSLEVAVQVTKAGAVDVLPKPANIDFLISILVGQDELTVETCEFLGNPLQLRSDYIIDIYNSCGSASLAARKLKMHRRTLQRFIKRTNLRKHAG